MNSLRPLKEQAMPINQESYGFDMKPGDSRFNGMREKSKKVYDGTSHYSYAELEQLISKMVLDAG